MNKRVILIAVILVAVALSICFVFINVRYDSDGKNIVRDVKTRLTTSPEEGRRLDDLFTRAKSQPIPSEELMQIVYMGEKGVLYCNQKLDSASTGDRSRAVYVVSEYAMRNTDPDSNAPYYLRLAFDKRKGISRTANYWLARTCALVNLDGLNFEKVVELSESDESSDRYFAAVVAQFKAIKDVKYVELLQRLETDSEAWIAQLASDALESYEGI